MAVTTNESAAAQLSCAALRRVIRWERASSPRAPAAEKSSQMHHEGGHCHQFEEHPDAHYDVRRHTTGVEITGNEGRCPPWTKAIKNSTPSTAPPEIP